MIRVIKTTYLENTIFVALLVLLLPASASEPLTDEGLKFQCDVSALTKIEHGMEALFKKLFINKKVMVAKASFDEGKLTYTLATPIEKANTLDFQHRPEFWLYDEQVKLYGPDYKKKSVATVSKKEILLALMQHGRLTEFSGPNCSVKSLVEHIKLRQNIVTWAEKIEWQWPNGDYAKWNKKFWNRSHTKSQSNPFYAFEDAFLNQKKYSIGCYSAIKMTYVFGILDFYKRVKRNNKIYSRLQKRIVDDHEPLQGIEPYAMWSFEQNYDTANEKIPGKLLHITKDVAALNFVAGDWVYFVNTDEVSRNKVGYEGSNSIYLGRGYFVDFYNDAEHRYTYEQKLHEVYQWRHGVFSQSAHYEKAELLSKDKLKELGKDLENGGVVLSVRAMPDFFH